MEKTIDRHDIPPSFLAFLSEAQQRGLADQADLWVLAATHGNNYRAAVDEVLGWAFSSRHSEAGVERHAVLVRLAERFWMSATPATAVAV